MKKLMLPWVALLVSIGAQAQSASQASLDRGKIVYETYCLVCHQADGTGVPGMNPPLTKTKWVLGEKLPLINIVLKGMDEEIEISGDFYNNLMPPHDHLTDQEIADVLTYVRNNFGNKASTITIDEVKKARGQVK
ncbi:MAG: cytochrome c [Bacteroidia bacterium]|nr:cytochrome c [Bacteroidia bacterium]